MARVLIILIKKLLRIQKMHAHCTIGWDVFKKKLRIDFLYGVGTNNLD